jgi:hypothetical protein
MVRGAEVDRPWIDDSKELLSNWAFDSLFDFVDPAKMWEKPSVVTYSRANRHRSRYEEWNAAKLFLTACDWLRDNTSRNQFFLWLDCFDPHEPWDAPPEFVRLYDRTPGYDGRIDPRAFLCGGTPDLPEQARHRIAAVYAAKVSWVDHWLGRLLDTLDQTGLAQRTAIVLTSDHGTNVAERGTFGKSYPVREGEGHTPFFVHVPDAGSGWSHAVVQPQDVLATILGIADVPVPPELESQDVLAIARRGDRGGRPYALAGQRLDGREGQPDEVFCTVFADDYYCEVTPDPVACKLTRYGTIEDVAAEQPAMVSELHAWAMNELERRGTAPEIIAWLRREGRGKYPTDCRFSDDWPGPTGFEAYWRRLYLGD